MAQQVTATILKVGTGPLFITPQNWSFPTQEIAIEEVHSGSINSSILFNSMLFYASETFSSLVAAANAGGGSGGNTIYSADDSIVSNRAVNLNSKVLNFNQGSNKFLSLDPTANNETVTIAALDNAGAGNVAQLVNQTLSNAASFRLNANFNNVNDVNISGLVDGINSLITYAANAHQFNGVVTFANNAHFNSGANGTFTSQDGKTITVTAGLVTSIT